jgi:hypothetical protein
MRRNVLLIAAVASLVVAGSACGGGDASVQQTPASSGASSGGPQSLAPGQLPTSSAGAATGTVTTGSATVKLGGDLGGTVGLSTLGPPALYSPPPGSTAVVWTDGAQTMGITGMSFEGRQRTSGTLALTLDVRGNGDSVVVLASTAGECTITVDTAEIGSLAGSMACTDLEATTAGGDTLKVDATGTFTASG